MQHAPDDAAWSHITLVQLRSVQCVQPDYMQPTHGRTIAQTPATAAAQFEGGRPCPSRDSVPDRGSPELAELPSWKAMSLR